MIDAIKHAERVYRTRDNLDRQQRVDEAIALGEWGVFSKRHVATLTGLRPAFVNELLAKRDKTGGAIAPESFGLMAEVVTARAQGEDVKERVRQLVADGFSVGMIVRLTGLPSTSVQRWVAV